LRIGTSAQGEQLRRRRPHPSCAQRVSIPHPTQVLCQRLACGGGGRGQIVPWLVPDRKLRGIRWVLGMRLFGVSCALLASIRSGFGAGYGVAEGLQAQCVGEEEATFSESVVSKIGGLPSLRLGNPTNDVTAHVGRIGGGQWQRVECSSPHSHTLLRAGTRLTRKPCRRTTLHYVPSTTWNLALLTTLH
jgi:hypothetical protein